ncbi:hypothetical protein LptCag_0405 [Leptospirillum ferriphilum]|uniref:Uncharacterized protein n=1 Tax=Leptospirillum ferriphilum TaxID=178606 RepID=A0A094X467_9BACT|nr:hypothetical protein LptCag_0405 [Leptospirillum ferriphilum]
MNRLPFFPLFMKACCLKRYRPPLSLFMDISGKENHFSSYYIPGVSILKSFAAK